MVEPKRERKSGQHCSWKYAALILFGLSSKNQYYSEYVEFHILIEKYTVNEDQWKVHGIIHKWNLSSPTQYENIPLKRFYLPRVAELLIYEEKSLRLFSALLNKYII